MLQRAMSLLASCIAVCALASFAVRAQEPAVAPPVTQQLIAIRAGQFLDVKTGALIKNAVILIRGERIEALGSGLSVPHDAKVVDLGAATLLPGLIDCHTHLTMRLQPNEPYAEHLLTKSKAFRALEGAKSARDTLLAGYTSVRDVETEGAGYTDVALRDAIKEGLIEGPRMLVATRGIASLGRYLPADISPDIENFPTGAQMVSGVEEARRAVREQIGHGADLIKVYADWEYPTFTMDELRVIVEEAHRQHLKVAAHASTAEGAHNAVVAGVDSVEHADRVDRATLELMRRQGTYLVSTAGVLFALLQSTHDEKQRKELQADMALLNHTYQLARQAGVKIAAGLDATDADMQGRNAQELQALVYFGETPLEAIQAETVDAAELLGWTNSVGTLEVGKFADIIAVDKNPLTEIAQLSHVKFVMKGGAIVENKYPHN